MLTIIHLLWMKAMFSCTFALPIKTISTDWNVCSIDIIAITHNCFWLCPTTEYIFSCQNTSYSIDNDLLVFTLFLYSRYMDKKLHCKYSAFQFHEVVPMLPWDFSILYAVFWWAFYFYCIWWMNDVNLISCLSFCVCDRRGGSIGGHQWWLLL